LIDGTHRLRRRMQDGCTEARAFLMAPGILRAMRARLQAVQPLTPRLAPREYRDRSGPETQKSRDDGPFFFFCPGPKPHERCERGPFYFAWGCFRDFVSGLRGVPPKRRCAASGTRDR